MSPGFPVGSFPQSGDYRSIQYPSGDVPHTPLPRLLTAQGVARRCHKAALKLGGVPYFEAPFGNKGNLA
jgi:hypothetical protein